MKNKKNIKQSTLNFILGGSIIILSFILVVLALLVVGSFTKLSKVEANKNNLRQNAFNFSDASADLTDNARAYIQFANKKYLDAYEEEVNITKTRENVIKTLKESGAPKLEVDLFNDALNMSNKLLSLEKDAFKLLEDGQYEEARTLLYSKEYQDLQDEIYSTAMKSINIMTERLDKEVKKTNTRVKRLTASMITLMAAMAGLSILSLTLSYFKIIKPMIKVKDGLIALSNGDLSHKIDLAIDDTEIGQLVAAGTFAITNLKDIIHETSYVLREMANGNLNLSLSKDYKGDYKVINESLSYIISSFNDVLKDVKTVANQVSVAAEQVSTSSMMLSEGATNQASSVDELTASVEEISAQTVLNAGNSNAASNLSKSAMDTVIEGNALMDEMLVSMDEINQSSSNISKIIKVIDDIAFQTNILALNAAVEAARAGEHGKGFAVVAQEVRTLAARSAEAAKETTEMIENSIVKTEEGAKIARKTADFLEKIVKEIEEVTSIVENISIASNEQSIGVSQINQGIIQVSNVVQSNLATSKENASASHELETQAEQLNEMVESFKLKETKNEEKKTNKVKKQEKQDINKDVLNLLDDLDKNNNKTKPNKSKLKKEIVLSDSEFGKY